ncbi:hypothetical protein, partial [Nostoc sp. NMS1]|uniref:hypothetical protein n=1 Tax=Nostoc sp. NMS1 TaxID=2815388 RepID=UPI0025D2E1D7
LIPRSFYPTRQMLHYSASLRDALRTRILRRGRPLFPHWLPLIPSPFTGRGDFVARQKRGGVPTT